MKTEWKQTMLEDLAFVNPRESLKKGALVKHVAMDCIDPFTRKISRFDVKPFRGGTKFRNGDTLMARITPCLENGKTSRVDFLEDGEVGSGSTEFLIFREKVGMSDGKFLHYLVVSPHVRELAVKAMTGTSGRQRVQTDSFIGQKLLVPHVEEQRSIAAVLSSLDDKIELLRAQNKTLEEMAQRLFKEWFVDFNFPNEDGKPYKKSGGRMVESEMGEIPEGWRAEALSDIAVFLNGLALQKYPSLGNADSLPVIKIREMKSGISDQTDRCSLDVPKKYLVQGGDVLFSWSGSLELQIWKYEDGALNQHLFKVTSETYPKWFYYYWIMYHLPNFKNIAVAKATTMGHIQRRHLDQALISAPDEGFMIIADEVFEPILARFISNNSQIQTLSNFRDILLPKLMLGEVSLSI